MNTTELKFYCAHCDQPLQCGPGHAGRQIQCPACQHGGEALRLGVARRRFAARRFRLN